MCVLKTIEYGSQQYAATLKLRDKVMRKPLGKSIYDEDFSCEKDAEIVGAFDGEQLLGVGVMTNKDKDFKLEYLCVDSEIQSKGIGGTILRFILRLAKEKGGKKVYGDARVSAKAFYEREGFVASGETYLMDIAPVPHVYMEKIL